jgi:DNA polymerase III gamma/tau subunit
VFVLVTTEAAKIPETVRSRLLEFEFRLVSATEIFDRLMQVAGAEQMTVSTDLLEHLAQESGGSVRRALMDLEKAHLAGISTAADWIEVTSARDVAPQVLLALFDGRIDDAFRIVDVVLSSVGSPTVLTASLVRCLRDVMVIKAGGTPVVSADGLEARKYLASRLGNDRLVGALRLLWDLRTKVRPSEDPRGSLDLAVALLGEVFSRGREPVQAPVAPAPVPASTLPVPAPPEPVRRLTLAEMTI